MSNKIIIILIAWVAIIHTWSTQVYSQDLLSDLTAMNNVFHHKDGVSFDYTFAYYDGSGKKVADQEVEGKMIISGEEYYMEMAESITVGSKDLLLLIDKEDKSIMLYPPRPAPEQNLSKIEEDIDACKKIDFEKKEGDMIRYSLSFDKSAGFEKVVISLDSKSHFVSCIQIYGDATSKEMLEMKYNNFRLAPKKLFRLLKVNNYLQKSGKTWKGVSAYSTYEIIDYSAQPK
jgi:hypothetical protein